MDNVSIVNNKTVTTSLNITNLEEKHETIIENGSQIEPFSPENYLSYGIMWEYFLKTNISAKKYLYSYYNTTEILFAKRITIDKTLTQIYASNTTNNAFIDKELDKSYVVLDAHIPSKKIILEFKLSLETITLKDIAYIFYFPDHELHFLLFIPGSIDLTFEKVFKKNLRHLLNRFIKRLKLNMQKFDPKEILEKIKLINRNGIEGFPVLDDNLKTLENYFPIRAYICEFCEDNHEFSTYLHYVNHKRRKHDSNSYPCELCGSVLANKLSLKNHIFDIHKSTVSFL